MSQRRSWPISDKDYVQLLNMSNVCFNIRKNNQIDKHKLMINQQRYRANNKKKLSADDDVSIYGNLLKSNIDDYFHGDVVRI